jgi:subtilisin
VSERAKKVAVVPDNSQRIDKINDEWILSSDRYWILSDSSILKKFLNTRHDFGNYFSAKLSSAQLSLLRLLGVKAEPVKIYKITEKPAITGKPVCGDGILHPREDCEAPDFTCPEGYECIDCRCEEIKPLPERTCFPNDQTPWGIEKVYGDPNITKTSGGLGIDVAVLDTGVMKEHLDLVNKIEQCVDFTHQKFEIREGKCDDGHGHGTHVSGTILADGGNDGLGIFGVAPEADLFAYKVCSNAGFCFADDIAKAIDYAAKQGAEIVNMSFGSDIQSLYIKDAINRNLHLLYVAAAGNDGPETGSIDYPGANVKVIAAGAIDINENVPDWSSRGINDGDYIIEEKEIEFATPGVYIESTYNDGCYVYMSGTSMAAPHVSGLAAKLWQGNAPDTRDYLQNIAKDIWEAGDDTATGVGLPLGERLGKRHCLLLAFLQQLLFFLDFLMLFLFGFSVV